LPVIVRDPFSPQPELILSRGQGEGVNLTVCEIPFFKQGLKKCKVIFFREPKWNVGKEYFDVESDKIV